MLAKTGKTLSQLLEEINEIYGTLYFDFINTPYAPSERTRLEELLMEEKYVPEFGKEIQQISYIDGVKFYFADETWLSIRFSGTEPILRIFLEARDRADAEYFKQVILNDQQLNLIVRNEM